MEKAGTTRTSSTHIFDELLSGVFPSQVAGDSAASEAHAGEVLWCLSLLARRFGLVPSTGVDDDDDKPAAQQGTRRVAHRASSQSLAVACLAKLACLPSTSISIKDNSGPPLLFFFEAIRRDPGEDQLDAVDKSPVTGG